MKKDYVSMVDELLDRAIAERASDIHLEPFFYNGELAGRIRFRIDGVLQNRGRVDAASYRGMVSRIKITAKMNITEKRLPQDGKFMIPDRDIDVRVASLPEIRGEKLVLRLLSNMRGITDIDHLGLTVSQRKQVAAMLDRKRGLILVCGPTGCGKSTTLYSVLRNISTPEVNITTIEDPVEMTLNGITQVQLQENIDLNYATVLKAIMRQDPDIIMVGEIRDRQVAAEAVRFAMTGHQVLTTLHTIDAAGSVKRMLEMGVEPYLLADVLEGVIAQRLVRRVCPHCREKILSGDPEKHLWKIPNGTPIYRAAGCEHCSHTGYYERIGVFEILSANAALKQAILQNRPIDPEKFAQQASASVVDQDPEKKSQTQFENPFKPFKDGIRNLILQGITTTEEGVRVFGSEINR